LRKGWLEKFALIVKPSISLQKKSLKWLNRFWMKRLIFLKGNGC